MVGDDAFAGTDYHFNVCGVAAVYDVFLRQQVVAGITTAPSLCSATMLNQNS